MIRKRWPEGRKPWARLTVVAKGQDLIIAKFDDAVAHRAVQMVVRGIAVIVFVSASIRQAKLAQQARLDQQPQRPVNGGAADSLAGVVQVANQLVGVEVLVGIENMADQCTPGAGQLLAPNLEKFAKFLLRSRGNGQRHKFFSGVSATRRSSRSLVPRNGDPGRGVIKNHSPL